MADLERGETPEPPPPVEWEDVAFHGSAAREAAGHCERLAHKLAEVVDWHRGACEQLAETWRGALAEAFTSRGVTVRNRLAECDDQLMALAASLRRAAEAAAAEQAERERQREQWLDWDVRRRREQRLPT